MPTGTYLVWHILGVGKEALSFYVLVMQMGAFSWQPLNASMACPVNPRQTLAPRAFSAPSRDLAVAENRLLHEHTMKDPISST